MKNKLSNVPVPDNSKNEIVQFRKANIVNNLPVTARLIRLREQQELLRVLINHYIFHTAMEEKLTEELIGFLEYTEQLYMKPNTILSVIRQQHLLESLPYLLSVMRYEIRSIAGKSKI